MGMSLIDELILREGYREDIYLDITGLPTGGYGHLITSKDHISHLKGLNSRDKKRYWTGLLVKDVSIATQFIEKLTEDWQYEPNDPQLEVLIELCFNLGATRLLGFKRFLKYMAIGEIKSAARELIDSKWHRDFVKWNSGEDTPSIRSRVLETKLLRSITT